MGEKLWEWREGESVPRYVESQISRDTVVNELNRCYELKAELDTFRDASLLLTGKLEDAQAELAALREAAQEAKDLLWKMQNVQPYSDEIHYVGALLNTALLQERWG